MRYKHSSAASFVAIGLLACLGPGCGGDASVTATFPPGKPTATSTVPPTTTPTQTPQPAAPVIVFNAENNRLNAYDPADPGEMLPYASTGTPLGVGIDSSGTVYYADIGITQSASGDIGPGDNLGTVRRIRFENGQPLAPETMDSGLNFPDGIGVLE